MRPYPDILPWGSEKQPRLYAQYTLLMTCTKANVPMSLSTPISEKPDENILSIPKVGTSGKEQEKKAKQRQKKQREKIYFTVTRTEVHNWFSSENEGH